MNFVAIAWVLLYWPFGHGKPSWPLGVFSTEAACEHEWSKLEKYREIERHQCVGMPSEPIHAAPNT